MNAAPGSHAPGDKIAVGAWIALWTACLVVNVAVCRVLYGDGARFVFVHLVDPFHFNDYDSHRAFASYITQTPLLIAQRVGATHVATYARLYAVGTYVVPAAAFLLALAISRWSRLLFASTATAIVVFGFGVNYINSEANLFFALTWLSAMLIAFPRHAWVGVSLGLPVLAYALLHVYEGMLLTGPVLAAAAAWRLRNEPETQARIGLTLATLLYIMGSLAALGAVLQPRDPANAASFASSMLAYVRNPQIFLLGSCVCALIGTARQRLTWRIVWGALCIVLGCFFVIRMLHVQGYYGYSLYYYNRSFLALLLPATLALVLAVAFLRPRLKPAASLATIAALVTLPFSAAIAADLVGSARWYQYVTDFCKVLSTSSPNGIQTLKEQGHVTGWAWTHPTLSILLRLRGSKAMVSNDPGQWEPFDPATPPTMAYVGVCEEPIFQPRMRVSIVEGVMMRSVH